jgi:hypothetical protein
MKAYNQPLHTTGRRARVRGEEITRIGATRKRETGWSAIQSMRLAMAARTIRKGEADAAGLHSTARSCLWGEKKVSGTIVHHARPYDEARETLHPLTWEIMVSHT